jgi:mono/diheme cytochrome c family protein
LKRTSLVVLTAAMIVALAACLAIAGVLTSCDGGSSATTGASHTAVTQPAGATTLSPSPATSGGPATTAPRTGAVLFAGYCAGCHGNDGKAKLAPTVVGLAAATVKTATKKGTGSMPGFADRLSAADIDAVVAFAGTLK